LAQRNRVTAGNILRFHLTTMPPRIGMAIAISQVRGFIVVVLVFVLFWAKLRMEEEWMRSQFEGAVCRLYSSDRRPGAVPLLIPASIVLKQPQKSAPPAILLPDGY